MHIPGHVIDAPTSIAAGGVVAGYMTVAARQARRDDLVGRLGLTAVVAAFIFAAQMLNFPVAGGTSGHLLGGLLAAVLVGPWLGSMAVTTVLVVQCLLFGDGAVSALGLNIVNMAIVPAFLAYGLFLLARRRLPADRRSILLATAMAAFASVVLAALAFTVEYAVGGSGAVSVIGLAEAMLRVHVLIGMGEAVITTLTVAAALAVRPDLVFGAQTPADRKFNLLEAR
jgi:cobalt/nickel transport system permease protein